jgi:phosphoglycolate phosphatase-like HAD superfamily hydrolase
VERARNRVLDSYTERHHIIPRCIGGTDVKENLVDLTAREHFICHRLLVNIHPDNNKLKFDKFRSVLKLLLENNVKIGICTNKASRLVHKIINELKIDQYFDIVIAGDDLPVSKPNPLHLLTCLERLNISINDAIFVGDSTVDHRTAISANVKFAFYQRGYDDGVDYTKSIPFDDHLDLVKRIIKYE